ncbi:MAG: hypothetical protein JRI43_01250 [Deltaproteobacteria bacterium]|nr:hypothetical protein [Deltaproteobacteria bacterium]
MTDSKKDNQSARTQYEPPRLFDLGGGVAHAAKGDCKVGGSPAGGKCKAGTLALYADCKSGSRAGNKCQTGIAASGGDCKKGATAAGRCKKGGTAR